MSNILITNAKIWDATGGAAFSGDMLIEGNRIRAVSRTPGQLSSVDAQTIDADGMFLMPGMTEGHGHISFEGVSATEDLIRPGPEEQVFAAARGAKALLDAGFTSVYGASEAKMRLAVAVRNEVNAGRLPGPRIRAGGLEISVTGAMGDESMTHNPRVGPSIICDGPTEIRRAVRLSCREGCDNIKLDVSGDPFYPSTPGQSTPMAYDEILMAVQTAHAYGRKVNAHVRSAQGIKDCVRAGVDGLFHCEFTDEEALDMLEAAKDRLFVTPTPGLFKQVMNGEGSGVGLSPEVGVYMGVDTVVENSIRTHNELRKRGVRLLIGGDYGFAWSPQGTQARDLVYFVEDFGFTPEGALLCATRNGGLAMRGEGDLGTLAEGSLADMLLVNGNPLEDVSIMTDRDRLVMIMKDGQLHKNEVQAVKRRATA